MPDDKKVTLFSSKRRMAFAKVIDKFVLYRVFVLCPLILSKKRLTKLF